MVISIVEWSLGPSHTSWMHNGCLDVNRRFDGSEDDYTDDSSSNEEAAEGRSADLFWQHALCMSESQFHFPILPERTSEMRMKELE